MVNLAAFVARIDGKARHRRKKLIVDHVDDALPVHGHEFFPAFDPRTRSRAVLRDVYDDVRHGTLLYHIRITFARNQKMQAKVIIGQNMGKVKV